MCLALKIRCFQTFNPESLFLSRQNLIWTIISVFEIPISMYISLFNAALPSMLDIVIASCERVVTH